MGALSDYPGGLDWLACDAIDPLWTVWFFGWQWISARWPWHECGPARILPIPNGFHGYRRDHPYRFDGGTLEVYRLCTHGTLGQHVHLSIDRRMDMGWRLVAKLRPQCRTGKWGSRFCRFRCSSY